MEEKTLETFIQTKLQAREIEQAIEALKPYVTYALLNFENQKFKTLNGQILALQKNKIYDYDEFVKREESFIKQQEDNLNILKDNAEKLGLATITQCQSFPMLRENHPNQNQNEQNQNEQNQEPKSITLQINPDQSIIIPSEFQFLSPNNLTTRQFLQTFAQLRNILKSYSQYIESQKTIIISILSKLPNHKYSTQNHTLSIINKKTFQYDQFIQSEEQNIQRRKITLKNHKKLQQINGIAKLIAYKAFPKLLS